jgi:hypothetical protein
VQAATVTAATPHSAQQQPLKCTAEDAVAAAMHMAVGELLGHISHIVSWDISTGTHAVTSAAALHVSRPPSCPAITHNNTHTPHVLQASCGFCLPPALIAGEGGSAVPDECQDDMSACPFVAFQGMCSSSQCARSCRRCTPGGSPGAQ